MDNSLTNVLSKPQKESASKSNGDIFKHDKSHISNHIHSRHNEDIAVDGINSFRRLSNLSASFIGKIKKISIPTATFSSMFLVGLSSKAYAETVESKRTLWSILWERGSVENNPYANSGVYEGMSFNETFMGAMELWAEIGKVILKIINWFNNIRENVSSLSIDLLAWCYEIASGLVLQIPAFIFTNSIFRENILNLSFIAMSLVLVGFTYNAIKQMFSLKNLKNADGVLKNIKYDKFSDLVKRLAVAIAAVGFMPFILEKVFTMVNTLSKLITKLGASGMEVGERIAVSQLSGLDILALILFDILLIGTLIPVALQNGRRWFDIFTLSALSPLAACAWIFTDTRKYFTMWFNSLKKLCSIQLVYATFITFIGIIIFATKSYTTGWEMIFRLLIVAGGLYRMANPPAFINRMLDSDKSNILDIGKGLKSMYSLKSLNMVKPYGLAKAGVKGIIKKIGR